MRWLGRLIPLRFKRGCRWLALTLHPNHAVSLTAACLLWASNVPTTLAHTLPISFLTLVPDAEALHLELTFNPFELSFAKELDINHNGRIDSEEWAQSEISKRLLESLFIQVNGQTVTAEVSGIAADSDSHHATLRAHYPVDARTAPVQVRSALNRIMSSSHLTQVTFNSESGRQRAQLDMQSAVAVFQSTSMAGKPVGARPVARLSAAKAGKPWQLIVTAILAVLVVTGGVELWKEARRVR